MEGKPWWWVVVLTFRATHKTNTPSFVLQAEWGGRIGANPCLVGRHGCKSDSLIVQAAGMLSTGVSRLCSLAGPPGEASVLFT